MPSDLNHENGDLEMRVEDLLQNLIENFAKSPSASIRTMRELLEADRDAFLPAAVRSLGQARENQGYHYLMTLLAGHGLLQKCLCDPCLTLSRATTVARTAMQTDPTLARRLMQECVSNGTRRASETVRMLEILGEICDGRRLFPLLTRLLQHPNPRIRSEAALRIGRRSSSTRISDRYRTETDPRARADAIECLWGLEEEDARSVLWQASSDPNNRVAGNAVLGLYRIGDTRSIGLALEMATRPDARFRASAAWVMGSGDPRFLPALGRLLADNDPTVRARAFRSVARIRRAMTHEPVRLAVYIADARRSEDGLRQLRVVVVDADGAFPAVLPTEFVVWEDGQPVMAYDVEDRSLPGTLAIGFALPLRTGLETTRVEGALLECLAQKRHSDEWGLALHSVGAMGQLANPEPLHFSAEGATLRRVIGEPAPRSKEAGKLLEVVRRLLAGAALVSGDRHLVLIGSPEDACDPVSEIEAICSQAREQGVVIHALALCGEGFPVFEALCAATGGCLLRVASMEQAGKALSRIYWGLQYQHEIRYRLDQPGQQALSGLPAVKVQVWSEAGRGEDSLPLQ